MNPVDHPHGGVSGINSLCCDTELTHVYRVTINTLVKPLRSTGTLYLVRRQVLSQPGGLVCCVVLRRSRTKGFLGICFQGFGLWIALIFGLAFWY